MGCSLTSGVGVKVASKSSMFKASVFSFLLDFTSFKFSIRDYLDGFPSFGGGAIFKPVFIFGILTPIVNVL